MELEEKDIVSNILQNLGKYRQVLEHAEIPLEIVGMEINPSFAAEGGYLLSVLGPKFTRANRELKSDEVRFIVSIKK